MLSCPFVSICADRNQTPMEGANLRSMSPAIGANFRVSHFRGEPKGGANLRAPAGKHNEDFCISRLCA